MKTKNKDERYVYQGKTYFKDKERFQELIKKEKQLELIKERRNTINNLIDSIFEIMFKEDEKWEHVCSFSEFKMKDDENIKKTIEVKRTDKNKK